MATRKTRSVEKQEETSTEKTSFNIENKKMEGFADQSGNPIHVKEFLKSIMIDPGNGLTTNDMRSRAYLHNKLSNSETIELSKEEINYALQVLASKKFPGIVMSILELEDELKSKLA
jgi:hypothetical protein